MKRLLLFVALIGAVVSANAAIIKEDVCFSAVDYSETKIVPNSSKVQLNFSAENNFYILTQTTFSREVYPKFRLEYKILSGKVNVKIQSETLSAGYSGQYIGLDASKTSFTGTFSTEEGLDDDVKINTFQLQANGGAATIIVNKVVLIGKDNSETELTDGADGWDSHPIYFSGNVTITKNWGGLNLSLPSSFQERDKVTYTIKFASATTGLLQLQTVAKGDVKHYPDIAVGSTEFSYTVTNEELTEVFLKPNYGAFSGDISTEIASISISIERFNILDSQTLYDTETTFDSWSASIELPAVPTAKTGDIIQVNLADEVSNQTFKFGDKSNGWADIEGYTSNKMSGTSIEFVINDAFRDILKAGNVIMQGMTYTASSIKLLTTDNSIPTVSVSAAGYASCFFNVPVDFTGSGATAYIVSEVSDKITLTDVTKVPANTGIVVKAAAGTYTTKIIDAGEAESVTSLLTPVTAVGGYTSVDGDYVLAKKTAGVGFYPINGGIVIAMGKSYLPASSMAAHLDFLGFEEGNTTAIDATLKGNGKTTDNVVYNLNGQRVAQPAKGLYIVNGKKVVIK